MGNSVAKKQDLTPAPSEAATILSIIDRAARDESVDIDKMERLLAMQERVIEREAKKDFDDAMRAAQQEIPQIYRSSVNSHTKSRYATLEAINEAINPVITEHGFSMTFGTDESPLENHYRVTCDVSHNGGYSRSYHADVPSDTAGAKGTANKSATQGFGSTMSYGRRYLTLLIFNVALTNEDNDGNRQSEFITQEQQAYLANLAKEVGANVEAFFGIGGISSWAEMPAKEFKSAKAMLNKKREQKS